MKFLSWNIWSKGSIIHDKHWQKAAQQIKQWQPDLIGLQEIDYHWSKRSEFADVSKEMADILGYHCFYCPSIKKADQEGGGQYGNAILSKLPFVDQGIIELSPQVVWDKDNHTTEPRTVAWVEVKADSESDKKLVFLTTHLSNALYLRSTEISRQQATTLTDFIKTIDSSKDIVLCGDFNMESDSQEIKQISSVLSLCENKTPTWTIHPFNYKGWQEDPPAKFIIDYFFSNIDLTVSVKDSLLSDHLPLLAEQDI
jgi:endonuclease/exonuclease/phosphatase family metal-dependent hydrolase